jgi:hypothetical protein
MALKPAGNPQMVKMSLEKNPQKLQPKTYTLRIEESGMHEYSSR